MHSERRLASRQRQRGRRLRAWRAKARARGDPPVEWHAPPLCQVQQVLKRGEELVCMGPGRGAESAGSRQRGAVVGRRRLGPGRASSCTTPRGSRPRRRRPLAGSPWVPPAMEQQAQPLASSIVSARSAVVAGWPGSRPRPSPRSSLASMFTLATSFTMHPIFSLVFCSTWRSSVVLPGSGGRGRGRGASEGGRRRAVLACAGWLWLESSVSSRFHDTQKT